MRMSNKNKNPFSGIVFSTNPDFKAEEENEEVETLPPAQQKLRVVLETKHRGGKAATIIDFFVGKTEDLEVLGKQLKNLCGTGGSVKDGVAIIQGDHREKIVQWLIKQGYTQTKKSGG
jgi:translation initiation factor 1